VRKNPGNILKLYVLLIFSFQLFFNHALFSQDDILNKKITADFNNTRLNDAFRLIEKELSVYFTFDGSLVNTNKLINQSFKSTPLQVCLDKMLEDSSLYYRVIENHIVIRCCKSFDKPQVLQEVKPKFITLKGKITDKTNKDPLPFASIGIPGYSHGMVSNNDGEFIFKIPAEMADGNLCISCVGYTNLCLPINKLIDKFHGFELERSYISIQEVIIRKTDARNLIRGALNNVRKNYSREPVYFTGFYREKINKNGNYLFFSEAVMQIYKSSYQNVYDMDLIKILKTRKMQDLSMEDTVIVKLKSGLHASLSLDLVKNPIDFLQEENFNDYKYVMSDIISIDDRSAYLIDFEPQEYASDAIYQGKIYIDIHDLAIVGCEFEVNKKRISKNQSLFIAKKKKDLNLKISNVNYAVSYRKIGNIYFLNYVSGDINMKVRKKGRLFYFDFDISFEMAMHEIETENVERFKRKDVARLHTVFYDEVFEYDEAFWEHYNFIKPDKPLQEILKKDD
jgi:hypothetical protein